MTGRCWLTPIRSITLASSAPTTDLPGRSLGDAAASRVLLFSVGGELHGCELAAVREIVPLRRATRLPGAPSFVCGLINLRGSIVTVVDLGLRLRRESSARPDASIVLLEHGAKVLGLLVDDVKDVQPVAAADIDTITGEGAQGGIVRGLCHLDDNVVILLDVQTLVRQVLL
jgi:purine-binding chemotaxis protein CheW